MKSSPVDTFCRALVFGGILGACGWGAIRYTDLPQLALEKLNAWNREAQNSTVSTSLLPESATAPPSSIPQVSLPQVAIPGAEAPQQTSHPTQQAAYLEPSPTPFEASQSSPISPNIRESIERRLCDLGAVYSLLEMWGHNSFQYRYHCRIAIANNRQVTRSFEANGTTPEDAMRQVLRAVESFQSTSGLQSPPVR
ncbi:MAG: hypothetical protein P8K78_05040 [Pirellulales bacterium]|nr:hypothetical protein [Pirellulales bacterium]